MNAETTQTVMTWAGMPIDEAVGGFVTVALIIFGIALTIAAILLPLFVASIWGRVGRVIRLLEKVAWYLEQEHKRR